MLRLFIFVFNCNIKIKKNFKPRDSKQKIWRYPIGRSVAGNLQPVSGMEKQIDPACTAFRGPPAVCTMLGTCLRTRDLSLRFRELNRSLCTPVFWRVGQGVGNLSPLWTFKSSPNSNLPALADGSSDSVLWASEHNAPFFHSAL